MPISQIGNAAIESGSQYIGFKNRIINGAMMIDQRNAGAAVSASLSYPVDRFVIGNQTDGVISGQQSSTAPGGFSNSVVLTTTTADASLAAGQYIGFVQYLEGLNCADFSWGTANASSVTLSFWVRSSLTGTFSGSLRNSAGDRTFVFNYTINAANTWEYKTIVVAGDTSGTWLTSNYIGIRLWFSLGTGSAYSGGTAGSWVAGNYLASTGATSLVGTLNATLHITGVQLEKGSVATAFDYRPYGTELQLCQRYFANIVIPGGQFGSATGMNQNTTISWFPVQIPFRATPTVTYSGGLNVIQGNTNSAVTSVAGTHFSQLGVNVALTCSGASFTAGYATTLYASGSTSYLNMSAEL